ncbi:MMPL family transporter [Roseiarcus sp.]|uniref:MMPL family transporter n=1 Tax=Roseiarcus sp. TaxID=1969460 RepID=UPI003F992DDC
MTAVVIAVGCGIYAGARFRLNSDINALLPANVEWRKRELAFEQAFRRFDLIEVVIEAPTPELAAAATRDLADVLASDKTRFQSVANASSADFFARNALMYPSLDALKRTAQGLSEGEPLIHDLSQDRSLRGLVAGLEDALLGLQSNRLTLDDFTQPLTLVSNSLDQVVEQRPASFSWRALTEGGALSRNELRGFIEVHPVLDFKSLQPGQAAEDAIRQAAAPIAARDQASIRLTGPVVINDDQFGSIRENATRNAVITVALVLLILWLALRSAKLVGALCVNVLIGLAATAAAGALMVGAFNVISIYFAVLFVGIGVDFAIQFGVRYRDQRHSLGDLNAAVRAAGSRVATPLALAALATAAGFFSFLPTDYRGVSELGLIAGVGMLIAFVTSVTVLPALIVLVNPPGEPEPLGYGFLAPVDDYLARRRRPILLGTAVVVLCALPALYWLRFDYNPLDLQDPKSEAIATYRELSRDPSASANAAEVVAPSLDKARELAARFETLPEVGSVTSLATFIPLDQDQKVPIIKAVAQKLADAFDMGAAPQPPTDTGNVDALNEGASRLTEVAGDGAGIGAAAAKRLAGLMTKLAQGPSALREKASQTLIGPLDADLADLHASLEARSVTQQTLPPGLVAGWMTPDGKVRVSVAPKASPNDISAMRAFVRAVLAVAPDATEGPHRHAERRRHDPLRLHSSRRLGADLDRASVVARAAPARRRAADACSPGASRRRDNGDHGADRNAVQFRQHHRSAAASRRRRRVQDLLHHGLARGGDASAPDAANPRRRLQRSHHRDGLRKPLAFQSPRHVEHGKAARALALFHARRGGRVPTHPDGETAEGRATSGSIERWWRSDREFMMSIRTLLVSAALIGASSIAMAQSGTPEEQTACRPDVRKFCFKVRESDGSTAYLQCLQEHREKLSSRCRAVLESHGV